GPLRRVALRRPQESFIDQPAIDGQWRALNYTAPPDMARPIAEPHRLAAILGEAGVRIAFRPAGPALGRDGICVRDAASVAPGGLALCNMGKPARSAEPGVNGRALAQAGVPVAGAIADNGRIEGGDLVWLDDRTLAVGRTYRTNDDGIRQLKA